MWEVSNFTPYAVDRTWVVDKQGTKSWVVVVKATFDILDDGRTRLADDQPAPLYAPEYRGEPGMSSVVYEADLIAAKPGTDVILNGHAYSPAEKPADRVDVTMQIASIRKSLRIVGDRFWNTGLAGGYFASAPKPFTRMPIIYERAFGGFDDHAKQIKKRRMHPFNPVGTGFVSKISHRAGQRLPNVEPTNGSARPKRGVAGFGAIASYWKPRLDLAGTYDDAWRSNRFPLLPTDFQERFHMCAPEDQQILGHLRGGEPISLRNLTLNGQLSFDLPKVYPTFSTSFGRQRVEHRAKLATVIIEPDFPRVQLVYHTQLACDHRVDELDVTVVQEKEYR